MPELCSHLKSLLKQSHSAKGRVLSTIPDNLSMPSLTGGRKQVSEKVPYKPTEEKITFPPTFAHGNLPNQETWKHRTGGYYGSWKDACVQNISEKTNVSQTMDKVFPLCQRSWDSVELPGLALLILWGHLSPTTAIIILHPPSTGFRVR